MPPSWRTADFQWTTARGGTKWSNQTGATVTLLMGLRPGRGVVCPARSGGSISQWCLRWHRRCLSTRRRKCRSRQDRLASDGARRGRPRRRPFLHGCAPSTRSAAAPRRGASQKPSNSKDDPLASKDIERLQNTLASLQEAAQKVNESAARRASEAQPDIAVPLIQEIGSLLQQIDRAVAIRLPKAE